MSTEATSAWLVYAQGPNSVWQQAIEVSPSMTVQQAIESSNFVADHPEVDWRASGVGIFGKRVTPDHRVSSGDRIEIYRVLVFDPKESRRRRAAHRQRQKPTGAKRRGR